MGPLQDEPGAVRQPEPAGAQGPGGKAKTQAVLTEVHVPLQHQPALSGGQQAVWRQSSAGPGFGSSSARKGPGGPAASAASELLCPTRGHGVRPACLHHDPRRDQSRPVSGSSQALPLPAPTCNPTGPSAPHLYARIRASLRQKENTAGLPPPSLAPSHTHRRAHTHSLWFLGWKQ